MVADDGEQDEGAPAAFDPSIFEDVPACMVPSESERIELHAALFPNGTNADSEMF